MGAPILVVDFDAVLHRHDSPWRAPHIIPDPAVEGMQEFLAEAVQHFRVCVFSSRSSDPAGFLAVQDWLRKRLDPRIFFRLSFPITKPPACVTLDACGITFDGTFPSMETLRNFKPWNKKDEQCR